VACDAIDIIKRPWAKKVNLNDFPGVVDWVGLREKTILFGRVFAALANLTFVYIIADQPFQVIGIKNRGNCFVCAILTRMVQVSVVSCNDLLEQGRIKNFLVFAINNGKVIAMNGLIMGAGKFLA
jgi:hypothetical protein